ncbi:MAG: citrate synthase [Planctomycetota bacterium]|nr:MAG: citrate synthase [Planctomycetota bacterium]
MAIPTISDDPSYRPGLEGVQACRSSICHVDGQAGKLEYRGIDVKNLAEHSSFEETIYLLLYNHLPVERELNQLNILSQKLRRLPAPVLNPIEGFPAGIHPLIAMQALIALLQGDDYYADDISNPHHNLRRAVSLISKASTMVAAIERHRHGEQALPPVSKYSHAENFLFMLTGEPPHECAIKAMDLLLILHAEHGMNNSTFTARVIGSTNASIYSSISGAVGALSGFLHGGANERVVRMLYSIGDPENVEAFVEERLSIKKKIMGIGHRVYKVKDPRATILQGILPDLIEQCSGEEVKRLYNIALRLEEVVTEKLNKKDLYPNVDFYSGIVMEALGIASDLFTAIFAMSRVAGWCAHWLEQVSANRLFRPKLLYMGDHNRPYIQIKDR